MTGMYRTGRIRCPAEAIPRLHNPQVTLKSISNGAHKPTRNLNTLYIPVNHKP